MRQVVQSYRTGKLFVDDVPTPLARPGGVLVRTCASAVSAGTERQKVELAQKSLFGKALARPDQVRKVIDTVKAEGLASAYEKVRSKLDSLNPLGYSSAGIVVAVGAGVTELCVGDRVACAGAGYANHAEYVWVPKNLCARIPAGVSFEHAAYATLGAIALQGVRQAEARFGETVAVLGLGLLGQLTVQLLKAAGCMVAAIDLDPWKVELARRGGADLALLRSDPVVEQVGSFTSGRGADAVVITAAATSNDPIVLAGELARDRAHVVVVGAVSAEIPRTPYFEKELDVRMSRSYGPGRYDVEYEEHGAAYPVGYVRWTETRNLEAFLAAAEQKRLDVEALITHRFPIGAAERAYQLLSGGGSERVLGVLLTYPGSEKDQPIDARRVPTPGKVAGRGRARVGFIGAGSFAAGTLIPILKKQEGVALVGVCTASGLTARTVAVEQGFAYAAGDPEQILADEEINTVFIATRHESHADLVARALDRGKAVFVEKPLALTAAELERVVAAAGKNPSLLVGFNRHFSPHTRRLVELFAGRADGLMIDIRVNAGPLPEKSWIHESGRLLGEGCHFVALAQTLAGAAPVRVSAAALDRRRENFSITVTFADGSLANILYTSRGDRALGKERIEVFGAGTAAVIDDFRVTTVARQGKTESWKTTQDKGHREELRRFVDFAARGGTPPIALADLVGATRATLAALESIELGRPIDL